MKNKFILRVLPDGDIEIIKFDQPIAYQVVYHKTYDPGDNLQDNLLKAFAEWERLTNEEYCRSHNN